MKPYRVLRDIRLASGARHRAGDTVTLSPAAAQYPLLRGWIAHPAPPDPDPAPPERPSGGRRRSRGG